MRLTHVRINLGFLEYSLREVDITKSLLKPKYVRQSKESPPLASIEFEAMWLPRTKGLNQLHLMYLRQLQELLAEMGPYLTDFSGLGEAIRKEHEGATEIATSRGGNEQEKK
jgi:hypothetical protein